MGANPPLAPQGEGGAGSFTLYFEPGMASRGRGRGQSSDFRKSEKKVPKSIDELARYLHSLDESNVDVYGAEFAGMVRRYADSETKVSEVVQLVFDTTVASKEYSVLGSRVCELIVHERPTDSGHTGPLFVSDFLKGLLKHFQSEVKEMKRIRSKSIEHWLGIFAFLCEIYHKVKISGKPITVVGKSILQNIDNMLNNPDTIDDEIDTICNKLKVCGKLLEEQDIDLMKNILGILRKQVISGKSTCQRRCLIMEVIEFRQLGWADQTGSLDKFYADALADAMVEDEVHN